MPPPTCAVVLLSIVLLRITRLLTVFEVYDTTIAAEHSFARPLRAARLQRISLRGPYAAGCTPAASSMPRRVALTRNQRSDVDADTELSIELPRPQIGR